MLRFLAVVTVFLFVHGPAWTDDLSGLVRKHIAWRGGPAFEAMTCFQELGTNQTLGMTGAFRRTVEASGRAREESDFGQLREIAVIGDDPWKDLNGRLEDIDPKSVKADQRLMALEFAAVLKQPGASLRMAEPAERNGRSWAVLRVSHPSGAEHHDLYLDPVSGALHGVRTEDGWIGLSDWRWVGAVRMPFLREFSDEDSTVGKRIRLSAIGVGCRLTPAMLARPQLPEKTRFARGLSTGPLPITLVNGTRIFVDTAVNGHPTPALLDSGAAWTVLDRRFAEKIGVKPFGSRTTLGTGGQAGSQFAAGVDVALGDLRLDDLLVLVMDLEAIEKRLGIALPVILGHDAFDKLIVDMDFRERRISFSSREGFAAPAGVEPIAFPEIDGVRTAPVSIEERPPVLMAFDVGNGSTPLIIHPHYESAQQLLSGRRVSTTLGGGIGGQKEWRTATLRSITFAGASFSDVPARFPPRDDSTAASEEVSGNIGMLVLGRFRLITDYAGDRLWALPIPEALERPFEKDRSGLVTRLAGDRLIVELVARGGPAERAGFQAGDQIVEVNGRRVGSHDPGDRLGRWNLNPAGERVDLRLQDGSTRTLVLADYF